jgi:hypothetical protein
MRVLIFSPNLSVTYIILRIHLDMIKNVTGLHVKYPLIIGKVKWNTN